MTLADFDRWLAHNLPTSLLKDFYPRAMRRLTEYGLIGGEYVRETEHGFRMNVDRLDAINWCIHYYGEWERDISAAIKAVVPVSGTILDIGGNVGYTAMLAAKVVGPAGRVFTFEPCERTFVKLERNVALNDFANIVAIKAAISDFDGEAILHCMGDNDLGQASLVSRPGVVRSESVRTMSLATVLEMAGPVDLIKIDVEGIEDRILGDLSRLLNLLPQSCVIMTEVDPRHDAVELLAPLQEAGYGLRVISNEYDTANYRGERAGQLSTDAHPGALHDIILAKDTRVFDLVERAMHRSNQTLSTSPACPPLRTPTLPSR